MRICYLARHGQYRKSLDDEGAITYALQQLGHQVTVVPEKAVRIATRKEYDLLLFHHYPAPSDLRDLPGPKVFWYFDLVRWEDPSVSWRNTKRVHWMRQATEVADLGFCTDGDWVAGEDRTGKLVWLPQGFDERKLPPSTTPTPAIPPILFTGTVKGTGQGREDWNRWMMERYPDRYIQVSGVYGPVLKNLVAGVKVLVAPDAPVTDRYWSNRVYNNVGMGGFLLHPWSKGLSWQYTPTTELMYYNDREHLRYLIDWYLEDEAGRERVVRAGLEKTRTCHLYRHRLSTMFSVLRQRGIVK